MTIPGRLLLFALLLLTLSGPITAKAAITTSSESVTACGGPAYQKALELWQHAARPYVANQLHRGLEGNGNVYVLYNTQERLQSFVAMTSKCGNLQALQELAETLEPAFNALKPLPSNPHTLGWVCTGGDICNNANRLLGHEVPLCSVQFLGLIGALAVDIENTVPRNARSQIENRFVLQTADALAEQLKHWLTPDYIRNVEKRIPMSPSDVTNASSKYFFTDRILWTMTAISDLADLKIDKVPLSVKGQKALAALRSKDRGIASMFNLFLSRITLVNDNGNTRAVLDRGFWRNFADTRYAQYTGTESPVACKTKGPGTKTQTRQVSEKSSYIDPNMGWDISHSRRLVPALEAFVRSKASLESVFNYANPRFDPESLQRAFANQIITRIWNKNSKYPLFSNYWDGSNGWYRSGYNNGTGVCYPGYGPYSLTDAIPLGGYLQWGKFNSTIRNIGIRLYALSGTSNPKELTFMKKHYQYLIYANTKNSDYYAHALRRFMFFSSLVIGK